MFSLAQQGYVAATVNYRLAPASRFPSQIQDVETAVRYLRSRAGGLNIDPDRIGVLGGSAGGRIGSCWARPRHKTSHRSSSIPTFPAPVQAVVSFAGPTDLTRRFPEASEGMVDGPDREVREQAPGAYEQASPLHHVSATAAPVLAIHGTRDEAGRSQQSTTLAAALRDVGVKADVVTIPDGGHGSGGNPEDWTAAIVEMVRVLRPAPQTREDPAERPAT